MIERELISEVDNGVRMFGYRKNNKLVGVMGIQELEGVTLIRHAYTLTNYQGKGIGTSLLQYLFPSWKADRNVSVKCGRSFQFIFIQENLDKIFN